MSASSIGRAIAQRPHLQGDRGHITNMIVARGFTTRTAALSCTGLRHRRVLALMETFGGYQFHVSSCIIFCVLSTSASTIWERRISLFPFSSLWLAFFPFFIVFFFFYTPLHSPLLYNIVTIYYTEACLLT